MSERADFHVDDYGAVMCARCRGRLGRSYGIAEEDRHTQDDCILSLAERIEELQQAADVMEQQARAAEEEKS